jgi:hypothetical protein
MTSVELFLMDVGTFRLKRRYRASVSAGGHLPQLQACGGDFESICTENNAKREEADVLQNSSNSNRICGFHCLGRSNICAITCASKRTDQVTLFASIHRFW